MSKEGFIQKLLTPSYKVKVKRYLTTNDLGEMYSQMGKVEKIVNNYGRSLTLNDGNVVFRMSTLFNTKKEIEIAIKTFLEVNYDLDEGDLNNLVDAYGSLAYFINNAKADHVNLEFRRCKDGNNVDQEFCKKIISDINHLLGEKISRMTYLRQYNEALKEKITKIHR